MRLSTKAILVLLLLLSFLMAITGWVSISRERQVLSQLLAEQGRVTARMIAGFCTEAILSEDYPYLNTFLAATGNENKDIFLLEVIQNKRVLSRFQRQHDNGEVLVEFYADITLSDSNIEQGLTLGTVRLVLSNKRNREFISSRIREMILFTVIVFLVVFVGLTGLLRKTILAKIQALDDYARRIGQGDFQSRLKFRSGDELAGLALTLNEMSDNILQSQQEIARQNLSLEEKALALEKSSAEAHAASRAKSEFLANMSHEIRTPLNAVIGFAELLSSLTSDEKQLSYLQAIRKAGKSLVTLINDILDLSRIEADKLDINPETIDTRHLFAEIQQMFLTAAEMKNLEFQLYVDDNVPPFLLLDEVRLRQILFNLVGNSIKFTEHGHVTVKTMIAPRHATDKEVDLIISVCDSGIGIPEDKQEHIFDSFGQQDGQVTRRYGGTGLGLAISRRLAELMGGHISVESKFGEGSTFQVYLEGVQVAREDRESQPSPEVTEPLEVSYKGETVLVVDDYPENRELIRGFLDNIGLHCLEAENGSQGVIFAREYKPQLILMDLRMPVMDGYEATRILKNNPATREIPIVAITAAVFAEEEKQMQRVGFDGYLLKPLHLKNLASEIGRFLSTGGVTGGGTQVPDKGIYVLSDDQRKNLPKLLEKLETEFLPACHDLQGVMDMENIEHFCSNLAATEEICHYGPLQEYAGQLLAASEQFSVIDVAELLSGFSEILVQVRKDAQTAPSGDGGLKMKGGE